MTEDEETRNTSDLLDDLKAYKPLAYVWRGQKLSGHEWVAVDAPEGGDSVRLGTFGMQREGRMYERASDDVRFVEVHATAWGDYTGSTYERSNARSIRRDFGEHVVTLTADFGFEVLLVRLNTEIPAELYDAIVELAEYPLYDEGDLSEVESELEQEDWESWGRSDWTSEIRKRAEAVDRDDVTPELDSADYVNELFSEIGMDGDVLVWQAETAVSGRWTDFERAAELAWIEIQRRRVAAWDEWARILAAPIPGQAALAW